MWDGVDRSNSYEERFFAAKNLENAKAG